MSRLLDEDYDIPNLELDFYFCDIPGSIGKVLKANGLEHKGTYWSIPQFESTMDKLIEKHSSIEKWIIKDCSGKGYFGLRFKTAKDKLAFTLKYL